MEGSPLESPCSALALLDDGPGIVSRIAAATGESEKAIRGRLEQENRWPGSVIRRELAARGIEPHVWGPEMERFYRESSAGMIEAVIWNRTIFKTGMRRWIGKRLNGKPRRLLCLGDGMGFDGSYFASLGHHVTSVEVSGPSVAFSRRVAREQRVRINFVENLRELEDGAFDTVVCLDVLEHLPQPEEAVRHIARVISPGGAAYINAPFWLVGPFHGPHLRSNMRLCLRGGALYSDAGLYVAGGSWFWDPVELLKAEGVKTPWAMRLAPCLWRPMIALPILTTVVLSFYFVLRRLFVSRFP